MKKNNKGFSLVELIIVIAIMAALVAVLAPQYIKYIEKSRKAADENTIAELSNAIKIAAADEDYTLEDGDQIIISTSKTTVNEGSSADLPKALTEYYGNKWGEAKLKSKGAATVTLTINIDTDGNISFTKA